MTLISGRTYLTLEETCQHWSFKLPEALSLEQMKNWLGSGKTGSWVVGPSGQKLVPSDEVEWVGKPIELATAYGARRAGGWLTIEFRDGQPLSDPLWPTPLVATLLDSISFEAAKRRAQRLFSGGVRIGYEAFYPRSAVEDYLRRRQQVVAGPALSGLARYGLVLNLQ